MLFDAIPISTPAGLAPLPTGAFSLPLGLPQDNTPGCLTQPNQYSAWSCKMTFAPLVITINDTSVDSNGRLQQVASVNGGSTTPKGTIQYGLQTPELVLQSMQLVSDLDRQDYGPAFHFSARYNKIVILRPEELIAGSSLKKRESDLLFRQPFQVQPGDEPWYCFWNATYIEGYIYAEDNSTAASITTFPSSASSTATSSQTLNSAAINTVATTPPSSTTPTMAAQITAPAARRDTAADASSTSRVPAYPRIVKIEERRVARSPQPYCQKMVLLNNGIIAPAPNGNNGPVRIWLQEQDPSYDTTVSSQQPMATSTVKGKRETIPSIGKRLEPSNACHCQWMFK